MANLFAEVNSQKKSKMRQKFTKKNLRNFFNLKRGQLLFEWQKWRSTTDLKLTWTAVWRSSKCATRKWFRLKTVSKVFRRSKRSENQCTKDTNFPFYSSVQLPVRFCASLFIDWFQIRIDHLRKNYTRPNLVQMSECLSCFSDVVRPGKRTRK